MLDEALPYIVTLASMFSVAYSLRFIRDVFFGPPPIDLPRTPHEPPRWMRFPVEILAVSCIVVGGGVNFLIEPSSPVRASNQASPLYFLSVQVVFLVMSTFVFRDFFLRELTYRRSWTIRVATISADVLCVVAAMLVLSRTS